MTQRPVIAVTMGDPAGVGPEITLKGLSDPELWARLAPLLVGSAAVFREAAGLLGLSCNPQPVRTPQEALRCFARSGMDAIAIGPFLVERKELSAEQLRRLEQLPDEDREPPAGPSRRELTRFGLMLAGLCLVWYAIGLWRGLSWHGLPVLAGCIGVAAVLRPTVLALPFAALTAVGRVVSRTLSTVVLGLTFVAVVVPMALLGRLVGARFLDRGFRSGELSYWHRRDEETGPEPASYERQF